VSPQPTILVADDEPTLRDVIAEFLADQGQVVLTASDGREAMCQLSKQEVDILITDIVMPGGMNGFQLARKAKRMRPNLRIIYMSGYYAFEIRDAGPVFGPVLQKPFRMAALLTAIGRTVA